MFSNNESTSSIHRVKNQTKEKFQTFLAATIQKKQNQRRKLNTSIEKLLNDPADVSPTSNDNEYSRGDVELKENDEENYILNKFLDNQTKHKKENVSDMNSETIEMSVRPPIPKPRKIKQNSPTVSQGTFKVASPKLLKKLEDDPDSSSSNKTYKIEPFGDILIHRSSQISKTIVMTNTKLDLHENDMQSEISSEQEFKESDSKNEKISQNMDDTIEDDMCPEDSNTESSDNTSGVKENKKLSKSVHEDLKTKTSYNYEKIVEITIHKTDRLNLDSFVIHPVVKIHIIDTSTGKYLTKSNKSRPVVFFYENNCTDYISPVMTHSYNLQEKRILYPSWEETILLNEDIEYFNDNSSHITLFFEVLDFVSVANLTRLNDKDYDGKGWHNIAFAFLKLSGKNGAPNMNQKMRLQLYYPQQLKKNGPQTCNPWIWWKNKKMKKYPSTIYVTIKPVISPTKIVETFRSKTPVQGETSSSKKFHYDSQFTQVTKTEDVEDSDITNNSKTKTDLINWNKKPSEKCKLPNKYLVELNSYDRGCFVMKFSHNGLYLACSVESDNLFYVVLYSVISFNEVQKFASHQGLIYCIKWSSDDSLLVSASADNTVSVFSLESFSILQILPHPSFVYCCDISGDKIIITGCYDGTVRIWNNKGRDEKQIEFLLFQELGHHGYVTSVCFNKSSNIFAADSSGVIAEWQRNTEDWILKRKINPLDLRETLINRIELFPKGKKLLVHTRDSILRIIDIKSGCILHWLHGISNKRFQIFSCISPCGTFVLSGSENGYLHMWNSNNGKEIDKFIPFSSDPHLTIHCVDFHPHDNIISISHYGKSVPVLLYNYDERNEPQSIDVTRHKAQNTMNDNSLDTSKWKNVLEKKYSMKSQEKLDIKSILQKMDSVIMSQKS